jgi:hypothetical protein
MKLTAFEIRWQAIQNEIACVPLRTQVKYVGVPETRIVRRYLLRLVVIDY